MLGVVPQVRKSPLTVGLCAAWNLVLLTPFIVAFWVLTEKDQGDNCFGMIYNVAVFARWTLLSCAIYQLVAIPLNIMVIKREQQQKGWILHEWMRMADALHWLVNWALWFYLIAGLSTRGTCPDGQIRGVVWGAVWTSVGLAIVGLLGLYAGLAILIFKNVGEINREAEIRTEQGLDKLAARINQDSRLKQAIGMGGVEVLDIRRSQVGNRVDLENQAVHDKNQAELAAQDRMKKDEVPITRSRRADNEPINIRDAGREFVAERTDYQENIANDNTRNIRTLDPRGGKF